MPLGTQVGKLIPLLFQVTLELRTMSSNPASYCCSRFVQKQKEDGCVNKYSFHKPRVSVDETSVLSNVFVKP